jgi:membrane protein YdbS with pleckstrin-like domain
MMTQQVSTIYPLRIFLLWQGIAVLLLGCVLGVGFLFFAEQYLGKWLLQYGIAHVVVVISIVATSLITKQWLTLRVDFVIRPETLDIIFDEPRQWFQPDDAVIPWNELQSWRATPGFATGQTLSPPVFTLQKRDGKKVKFYIAGADDVYAVFLMQFEAKLSAFNLQYAGVHRIHKMSDFSESKAVFIFFIVLSVIICFFTSYFYFIENKGTPDDEGYLVLYGIAILLVVLGYLVRRSEKKLEKEMP